jgi:proteasome lid subunit RPN8/RPN11
MTDSAILTWNVPECPFTIEAAVRVLDDIRLSVTDAFFSLPHGGAEIGGILLGQFDNGRLYIGDYAALECEHAHGPSFVLSAADEDRLAQLLSAHANDAGGLRPVGWYHSHTRSEIFLSEADLEIHRRFFPEPWQVALVMKPHTFQPARIGFFFRESDGGVHASASYREDVLETLPIRQMPSGQPSAQPLSDRSARTFRPLPVSAPGPALASLAMPSPARPVPESAPAAVRAPKSIVENASSARRWLTAAIAIVAGLGIGAAAYQVRQMWMPRVLAVFRPAPRVIPPQPALLPPPALRLTSLDHEGQLQISWDQNSPAVRGAGDALLEITDGAALPVAIQLDAARLQTGSFTYARTAAKVDIKLIVHQKNAPDLHEVTGFLGKLPERKSEQDQEAQQKQQEEMAMQVAKNKKLEQEVDAMRKEMRQQQQRRLNNQVPNN